VTARRMCHISQSWLAGEQKPRSKPRDKAWTVSPGSPNHHSHASTRCGKTHPAFLNQRGLTYYLTKKKYSVLSLSKWSWSRRSTKCSGLSVLMNVFRSLFSSVDEVFRMTCDTETSRMMSLPVMTSQEWKLCRKVFRFYSMNWVNI
jgi:hypothetical protein